MLSGMSKSSFTPFTVIQLGNFFPHDLFIGRNNHLCNTISLIYSEIFLRQIDQDDLYLTPVIRINGTWGVEHRYSFVYGQTTSRANLGLIAIR